VAKTDLNLFKGNRIKEGGVQQESLRRLASEQKKPVLKVWFKQKRAEELAMHRQRLEPVFEKRRQLPCGTNNNWMAKCLAKIM